MRDAGKKRQEMEMKIPDKMYPTLHVTADQVPELKDLPAGGTCRLVVDTKLKGFNGKDYHLEVQKVGKVDSSHY